MPRSVGLRGIVEGFYGRPWSHEARLDVLSFVGERGMNAYVYAPKDDPKHRRRWREPYDADEVARFAALARHADTVGIRFGLAISPGLDIEYGSAVDRDTLLAKLAPLVGAGVGWFLLALDDIALADGLAERQAGLACWLLDALRAARPDASLVLCPTEYVGTRPSPYLATLAGSLDPHPDIDVMWTGPTVCSPRIDAGQARAWSAALGGRSVVLWDNYPVNDGPMEARLHLGPYRGRDPDLADVVAGVLCNPMLQARASKVALATAAEFLADTDGYDPEAAWTRALAEVGGERRGPLSALGRACADSALSPPEHLELARTIDALEVAIGGPDEAGAVQATGRVLEEARGLTDAFPAEGDDDLASEVAPWADAARREADAGLAALTVLRQVRPRARVATDGGSDTAPPDAEQAMQAAFIMIFVWAGARARSDHVAFGPRFGFYPAVVQLPDGRPGLDVALTVLEDRNAIDRLCRLTLREYATWVASLDPAL